MQILSFLSLSFLSVPGRDPSRLNDLKADQQSNSLQFILHAVSVFECLNSAYDNGLWSVTTVQPCLNVDL